MSLGTLYRDALHVALGDGKNCVCYDYSSDFAELWRRCDGSDEPALLSQCLVPQPSDECQTDIGADEHSRHKRIIIVWDGQAPAPAGSVASDDPVHKQLEHHLTPLDWALAFSIRVLKDSEMSGQACFCINIIDLTAKQYEHAWAMRMRYQLLADMPWVRMFAPQVSGRTAPFQTHGPVLVPDSTNALLVHDSEWMVNVNECAKPIAGSVTSGHRERLMDMARQWSASLTRSDDHHDINNVIGSCLLSSDGSAMRRAFHTRLEWAGLFDDNPKGQFTKLDLTKDFEASLDVLMVDDQIGYGWGGLVCDLFGRNTNRKPAERDKFIRLDDDVGGNDCRIFGTTSADPLIEKLKSVDFEKRDYGLRFSVEGEGREIILLDLRLHSANDQKISVTSFYNKLLVIAAKTRNVKAAWKPISVNECSIIEEWLKTPTLSGEGYYSAITLLARLLALAAPLTPIIIFSSTGRSRLKEKFRGYRNIITAFEKPRVLSEPDSVADALNKLQDAVRQGLAMQAFQSRLHRVTQIAQEADGQRPADIVERHLEFYFDESDDGKGKDFTYAGALFAFPSSVEADALQQSCLVEFKKMGVMDTANIWAKLQTKHNQGNCLNNDNRLKKFSDFTKLIASGQWYGKFKEEVSRVGLVIGGSCERYVVAAKRKGKSDFEDGSLLQYCFRDQQMDAMVRFVLEFGLLILPGFLRQKVVSASIYFDERSASLSPARGFLDYLSYSTAYDLAKKEADANGLGLTCEKILNDSVFATAPEWEKAIHIKVYDENSFFPLVASTLSRWPVNRVNKTRFDAIRGVQLSSGTNIGIDVAKAMQRRLIHDIADWVAGCVRFKNTKFKNVMTPIFAENNWYVADQACSVGVMPLMNAVRAFANGNRGEGLRYMMSSSLFHSGEARTPMERVMCWSCWQSIKEATGNDLFYALDAHHTESHKPTTDAASADIAGGGTDGWMQVLQKYRTYRPLQGDICLVIDTYTEGEKDYWEIAHPESATTVIGYVVCHEDQPGARTKALMVAECDLTQTVKDGKYFVYRFVDFLEGCNELSDDGEGESKCVPSATTQTIVANHGAVETKGVEVTVVDGDMLNHPIIGWFVRDDKGMILFLRKTDKFLDATRSQRVLVEPNKSRTVEISGKRYPVADAIAMK